jgi:hypothetical protein
MSKRRGKVRRRGGRKKKLGMEGIASHAKTGMISPFGGRDEVR